jgi:hypothetical protein
MASRRALSARLFIVTNLSRPAGRVVAFYNKRGTCEQLIKEGKGAINPADAGPPATSSEIRTPGLAFPLRSNVRKSVPHLRLRNALEKIFMSKKAAEHHKKASDHHTHAARHHAEAAKYHEAGNHEKAAHHAHTARGHVAHARGHAEEAAKAHAEEHGKKSGP